MATILESLRDSRGIKVLDNQLESTGFAGKYDLLYHSNGYIYVAYGQNDMAYPGLGGRHIYMAISTDGGTTFGTPVQITPSDGWFYDNPAICQIFPGDTTSPIGMVFTKCRSRVQPSGSSEAGWNTSYPYRTMVDVNLTLTAPIDILTNYVTDCYGLSLVRSTNKFMLFIYKGLDYVYIFENLIVDANIADGFLDNAWTSSGVTNFVTGTNVLSSMKVKALANGHIALIGAVATETVDLQSRCDLGISFSADDGANWTAFQYLTSYTGTPDIDLVGVTQCLSADIAEVDSNQLAIVYQEGIPSQIFSSQSTPAAPLYSNCRSVLYHTAKNCLFISASSTGGAYVFDLTSGTSIFHFTSLSTPPIWSNTINNMSLSLDDKYLAIASQAVSLVPGALDIIDVTDATPANWTVVASLRTTTTPALKGTSVAWCEFVNNTIIVFTYYTGTTNYVFGGIVSASDPSTVIDLISPNSNIRAANFRGHSYVDAANDAIYTCDTGYVWRNKISDGTLVYSYYYGSSVGWDSIDFDPVHSELIVTDAYTNGNAVYRFKDTGSAITLLAIIEETTNPGTVGIEYISRQNASGSGGLMIFAGSTIGTTWYDFHSQTYRGGLISAAEIDYLGFRPFQGGQAYSHLIKNNTWLASAHDTGFTFDYVETTGKLRWGIFTYNPVTKLLDTNSDNFHLLCDTAWVSAADAEHLTKPIICAAPLGNICLLTQRHYPQSTGTNLVTGVMNREHLSLGMKAAIGKPVSRSFTSKSRVSQPIAKTFTLKARMVFAQCIKVRAYIIPEQNQVFQVKAAIKNWKSNSWTGSFNVTYAGMKTQLRLQFTVNTGYTGAYTTTAKARIVKVAKKRFTGHFIVAANPGTGTITFETSVLSYFQQMGMKAFLVSNR